MNPVLKPEQLPLRFVLSGLAAAVLLISTVLVGMYLGEQTRERFHNVDRSWQTYTEHAAKRGELLSKIRAHLGYGGIIHNFKNYVLRKEPPYLTRLNIQLKNFHATIQEYKKSGASEYELGKLGIVEKTIRTYEEKISVAKQAAREDWPPSKTDLLVKVDDTKAISAMLALDKYLEIKRLEAARSISEAVVEGNRLVKTGFFFVGVLAVVATMLYGMFFLLLRKLRQTITKLSNELDDRRAAELVAKKFQRAVDQSPATIIITDTLQKIEYVNKKFCDLTGYQLNEVLGQTPKFLQSGDISTAAYADISAQLQDNKKWQGTFRNLKKDGTSYWAETVILPLRDDTGKITHFIGLGEDVTEHKKAREHILRAQKMEAVGLLASGVAHDFNNVLTTILGNVHLARLDAPAQGEFARELEQIEIAAKRARHLVGQILAFARQQPGKATGLPVGELIQEILRLIRASTQPNIKLDYDVEDDQLAVYADPTRLHQVLMNLCVNATEAIGTAKGTVLVKAYRQEATDGNQPQVIISVTDDGPGIPPELQDDVFTPFFTTKRAGKGTGLGLSVVASHVNEMGGKITLESKPPGGCQFLLTMPEAKTGPTEKPVIEDLTSSGGKIMLIDDEPEVMATCASILRRLNYQVEAFDDPRKALEIFTKAPEQFDLIITDLVMPEISGQEVCEAARQLRPDCPIIVYSAYQPVGLELGNLKFARFIEKPFEPELLAKTVHSLLQPNDAEK